MCARCTCSLLIEDLNLCKVWPAYKTPETKNRPVPLKLGKACSKRPENMQQQ